VRVTPASLAWRFGCLVAACVVCRLVFQFSGQLGLLFAVVVALWVPGLALAKVTGLTARVYTSELLGLAPLTGLVAWTPLFFVALVVHMPFQWVVVLVLVASALALSWDPRPLRAQIPWEPVGILTGSFLFTGISTRYVPSIWGDALFHAGLIRKLLALPGISISGVSPYHNGHAHAGYAFPILHAVQAGAMSITGGDATLNYQNLTPAFAPMIPIAAYALGRSVANSPVGLAAALITCWDVMSFPPELSLAKQPPYFTLLIIFPAVMIILNYVYRDMVGRYWWVWTIVGAVIVGLLHDTTSVILLPLILAAVLLRPRAWPALAGSIAVTLVIFAAVYVIAIRGGMQVVRSPGLVSQWITFRGHHIASSGLVILGHRPEVLFGMIASAVILFRRQSPYRLPAAMVMTTLAVVAIPGVGLVLSHAIAGGQVARYTKVPPAIYVTAIVIGLTANWLRARRRRDLWAVSLASILISRWDWIWAKGRIVYGTAPGHYISGEHVRGSLGVFTGADLAVFAVMAAGGIGLIYCVLDRDRSLRSLGPVPSWGAVLGLVLALLIGSVVRHDQGSVASVLRHGSYKAPKVNELSAGLLQFFHNHEKAPFPVVMAPYWAPPDEGISYQLVGRTTVYTVALPQDHTRATPRDHPARRRGLAISFFNPHTPEATRRRILRAQDVDYVVLPIKSRSPLRLRQLESDPYMHKVYEDPVNVPVWSGRFVIFRFNPGTAH
jgi:hypothetical protein